MKSETKKHVEWLDSDAAATYLGFRTTKAFQNWVRDGSGRKPRIHRLGGRLRFRRVDLDACVEVEPEVGPQLAPPTGPRLAVSR